MLDFTLHTGAAHPALVWILVPSILSFVAGLGLGAFSDRLRDRMNADERSATE